MMTLPIAPDDLARLHISSLPRSQFSLLGQWYTQCFYKYALRCPDQFIVLTHYEGTQIQGALVLSLSSRFFLVRLFLKTPLLVFIPRLALNFFRSTFRNRASHLRSNHSFTSKLPIPELILFFVSQDTRSRGIGRSLIHRLESELSKRGITQYQVMTEADASNRANSFYAKNHFRLRGSLFENGTLFNLYLKSSNSFDGH